MKKYFTFFILLSALTSLVNAEDIKLAKLSDLTGTGNNSVAFSVPVIDSPVFKKLENRLRAYPKDHEAELLKSILLFRAGKLDMALDELNSLIKKVPDFNLAYLLKGDLLSSKFVDDGHPEKATLLASLIPYLNKEKKQQLDFLREEAQLRLQALLNKKKSDTLPRQILSLAPSVKKALLIDKKANRLYIFTRQASGRLLEETNDYYVTTGKLVGDKTEKGDLRTPEGVYFVTSWISPDKLPDKYGVGAFPVNYPNELDKHNGKTGYGIWLHGTDKGSYSRPPRDSEGCVVLTNIDLEVLKKEIIPGITPVVITNSVEWVDYASWKKEQQEIMQAIEKWRFDWESMNVDNYLSNYDKNFWSASHNLKSWSARKRYLAQHKTFQSVNISDVSVLLYPKIKSINEQVAVVRFQQDYNSNNFKSEMSKRLYLKKSKQGWKILYEGR